MAQIADIVGKILLFGVIKAPAEEVISINCTKEEIKMLILARMKSTLEKHNASYFSVDQFLAVLDLLIAPAYRYRCHYCPTLIDELEKEGKIAIVDFSPIDIYRIVNEPSPSPQTRS